jgi:hypothetical protein
VCLPLLVASGLAEAQFVVCQVNGVAALPAPGTDCNTAGFTWPVAWDTYSTVTEDSGDGPGAAWDLIGSVADPGTYLNRENDRLYIRMRVAYDAGTSGHATQNPKGTMNGVFWAMLDTNGDNVPNWAFGWDVYNGPTSHGLEMQVYGGGTATLWTDVAFDDIDGTAGNKGASDLNGKTGISEAWVRTVDSIPGVTGTFVDFAVSCSYFERSEYIAKGGIDLCATSFRLAVAASDADNGSAADHADLKTSATSDVGGGVPALTPTSPAIGPGGWGSPTAAVIGALRARSGPAGRSVLWETHSEVGTAGFNLLRIGEDGTPTVVNERMVPARYGQPAGGTYEVPDPGAEPGARYFVEEVGSDGTRTRHGPYTAEADRTDEAAPRAARDRSSRDDVAGLRAASGPSDVRVGVRRAGLVRMTAEEIAAASGRSVASVRASIRARKVQLTSGGRKVAALHAADGTDVRFYAEPLRSIYSDTNVYRLSFGAGEEMLRTGRGPLGQPKTGGSFVDHLRVGEDRYAAPATFHDPEADFWYQDTLVAGDPAAGTKTFPFTAAGATGGAATGTLHLLGITTAGGSLDHAVSVRLNGVLVGEDAWAGRGPHALALSVPDRLMRDGANTLEVRAALPDGVRTSVVGIDSLDLSYPRRLQAAGDRLALAAPSAGEMTVEGFARTDAEAFDVSDPLRPRLLRVRRGGPSGAAWVQFVASRVGARYLVASPSAAEAPAFVEAAPPAGTARGIRGAEYVVVAPPSMAAAAGRLAALRARRGLTTVVATTTAIYDDYSLGVTTPHALRAFLADALVRWKPAPRFVVLAGDGSLDFRNVRGHSDGLVPPLMADTAEGLAPSDARLADVVGEDGVPEVAIGRIPARDALQLDAYVAKLERAEAAGGSTDALLVADRPDGGGDFPADMRIAAGLLPPGVSSVEVSLAQTGLAATRERVRVALEGGAGFVHFYGHGGVDRLSREGVLASADVASLGATDHPAVVAAMTCVSANFAIPGHSGVGEALVAHPSGGALAVWGPTALELQPDSVGLTRAFLGAAYARPGATVGEAARAAVMAHAERGGASAAVPATFVLLGDPAVELRR